MLTKEIPPSFQNFVEQEGCFIAIETYMDVILLNHLIQANGNRPFAVVVAHDDIGKDVPAIKKRTYFEYDLKGMFKC